MSTLPDEAPLARQLLQLRQELAALRARVEQIPGPDALQEMVARLVALGRRVDDLEAGADEQAKKARLWDWSVWFKAGGPDAEEAWDELHLWVETVLGEMYGLVAWEEPSARIGASADAMRARLIPPCWDRHRDLIAELSWLCQEWLRIYRTSYGTPVKAGDWHDRYLLGLRKRIASTTAAKCKEQHEEQRPVVNGARH